MDHITWLWLADVDVVASCLLSEILTLLPFGQSSESTNTPGRWSVSLETLQLHQRKLPNSEFGKKKINLDLANWQVEDLATTRSDNRPRLFLDHHILQYDNNHHNNNNNNKTTTRYIEHSNIQHNKSAILSKRQTIKTTNKKQKEERCRYRI